MKGIYTEDRSFFTLDMDRTIAPGAHVLEFRENVHDRDNVLAFAEVYAHSPGFDFTHGKIAAFTNFNQTLSKVGYRPTFDTCLMRNMLSKEFCSVDQENMWQRFLDRVSLIEGVSVTGKEKSAEISLQAPRLEGMEIHWYQVDHLGQEKELKRVAGEFNWIAELSERGTYRVRAQFRTKEVRKYSDRFAGSRDFVIRF
ncbi:MAG: hypothetical protein AABZ55_10955 [Bdellovibrionota bacterium]